MGKNLESADSLLTDHEELALGGVLTHALPASLGTAGAPSRYTVMASFNRQPLLREITMIESEIGRLELTDAGYGSVTLTVAGRRLEIVDTNLEELKTGLAALVATTLHDASVAAQEATRLADLSVENDREIRRTDLVTESASEVVFEQASTSELSGRVIPAVRPVAPLKAAGSPVSREACRCRLTVGWSVTAASTSAGRNTPLASPDNAHTDVKKLRMSSDDDRGGHPVCRAVSWCPGPAVGTRRRPAWHGQSAGESG
jgi:hypothetical protein